MGIRQKCIIFAPYFNYFDDNMVTTSDIELMRKAMTLAQKGEGSVNPNPLVGALIVRDGKVIAEGYHARFGDLHAERNAFKDADRRGVDCKGATMYVTLEPCCHHGHQPPCTDAIIERQIARVVVGLRDPNPLVAGKGIEKLVNAGIEVEIAESLEKELRYQNRVFLKYITTGLPWVVMKYAMTLDGKICTRRGDSKWVSCEESRLRVHYLRRELTGILCGIGTVLADNPTLTTRIAKYPAARNPIRIVADRQARLPLESHLVHTAKEIPTIVVYAHGADLRKLAQLNTAGVKTWCCNSPQDLLARAGKEKIDGILLEGGGTLNEAFLREGLVDEVFAFIAPKLIGGMDAKTPVEGLGLAKMAQAMKLHDVQIERIGEDLLVRGLVKKDS